MFQKQGCAGEAEWQLTKEMIMPRRINPDTGVIEEQGFWGMWHPVEDHD